VEAYCFMLLIVVMMYWITLTCILDVMWLDPVSIIFVELLLEGRSGTWHRCFSWFGELLWLDVMHWVVVWMLNFGLIYLGSVRCCYFGWEDCNTLLFFCHGYYCKNVIFRRMY
jgi:hypothetical protein